MTMLFIYAIKVALCLTVFYLIYKLLLSRETFFGFNRCVLLGIVGLSSALPLVQIAAENMPQGLALLAVGGDIKASAVATGGVGGGLTAVQACLAIYINRCGGNAPARGVGASRPVAHDARRARG